MKTMVNPRSGHFSFGPNSNDPWYTKIAWAFVCGIIAVWMSVSELWDSVRELFK